MESSKPASLSHNGRFTDSSILIGFALLLFALFVTRFYNLDHHAFHHDESIHCYYSWKIINEAPKAYKYDPVYHGPFLYHWGALFLKFLPDTDFVARIPYALIGVALGLSFLAWGRRLGWGGSLLIGGLLTLSPVVDYFSRFARNDVYQTAWLAGIIVTGALYLWNAKVRYLTFAWFFIVLSYCTKENSYVHNFGLCAFLCGWGVIILIRDGRVGVRKILDQYLPLVRILVLFASFSLFTFVYVAIDSRIGPETGLWRGLMNILSHSTSILEKVETEIFEGESGYFSSLGSDTAKQIYFRFSFGFTIIALLFIETIALLLGQEGNRKRRPIELLASIALGALFYVLIAYRTIALAKWMNTDPTSNFFTGLALHLAATTGLLFLVALTICVVESAPWDRNRGSVTIEEPPTDSDTFPTFCRRWIERLSGLWGFVIQIVLAQAIYLILFTTMGSHLKDGATAGMYDYLSYWFKHQTGEYRLWGVWWYYIPRLLLFEILPITLIVLVLLRYVFKCIRKLRANMDSLDDDTPPDVKKKTRKPESKELVSVPDTEQIIEVSRYWKPVPLPLLLFAGYLVAFLFAVYAILNEKAPWLTTYQAFSLNLFAGLLAADWLARHPISGGPLLGRFRHFIHPAEEGLTRLKTRLLTGGAFLLFGFLIVFTIGQHIASVFKRPDLSAEPLVYTMTTAKFADQVRRIRDLQEQRKGKLTIAIEGHSEWPGAWYFRNDPVWYKSINLQKDVQIMNNTPENQAQIENDPVSEWEIAKCKLRMWWIWSGSPEAVPGGLSLRKNLIGFLQNAPNDQKKNFPNDKIPGSIRNSKDNFRDQIWDYVFRRQSWYPMAGERVLFCYKKGKITKSPPAQKE